MGTVKSRVAHGVLSALGDATFSVEVQPEAGASPDDAVYPLTSADAVYTVSIVLGEEGEVTSWQVVRGRTFDTGDQVVMPLGDPDEFWSWVYDEDGVPRDDFPVRIPSPLLVSRAHRVTFTTTLLLVAELMTRTPFSLIEGEVIDVLRTEELIRFTTRLTNYLLEHGGSGI